MNCVRVIEGGGAHFFPLSIVFIPSCLTKEAVEIVWLDLNPH